MVAATAQVVDDPANSTNPAPTNKLYDDVCAGQLDLKTAQHDIATDWIAAYKKYAEQ